MTMNHVGVLRAEGQARVQVGNIYYNSSDSLPSAHDAAYDSHAEQHNARCHPDTRAELLCQIGEWAHNPDGEIIFWLNGMAGTGKSTISRTVAKTFADNGLLGASFFFKRGEGDRGKAALFFPTIAKQLVRKIPAMEPYVRKAIDADPAIATKSLKDQLEKLIQQPLDRIGQAMVIVVVVDALDECDGDNDVKTIISLLATAKGLRSARLKIFITSRPELPIRLGFKNVQGKYQDLALHQIPEPTVERDISAFLKHELARIRDEYNSQALEGHELPQNWPGEHSIRTLAQMAVPLFIFAATVCRFVGDPRWSDPANQLEKVFLYQTKTSDSELDKLDATYLPVLSQLTVGRTDLQKSRLLAEFRDVVGPIILLAQPLSVSALARLINIPPKALSGRLNCLHSVLSIPSKADSPVRLFHLSFRDFLVDPTKRAAEFWIDEIKYHKTLTERCIQLISQHLKRDICGLQMPGKLRSEVDQQIIDAALPPEIQYACRYWVHHLKEGKGSVRDDGIVHSILTSHLLYWLEALGLLGWISESIGMVDDLLGLLDREGSDKISAFLLDTRRVIRSHCSVIDVSPLQVYHSAIVFTPRQSIVRRTFQKQFPVWLALPPAVELDWDACIQTLEGHRGSVNSVAFSHDSKTVASASRDQTIKLWDAATGSCTATLEGHRHSVNSVAFSHDSKTVASVSWDQTIKLWDAATGTCIATLEGHRDSVSSVAFSHDSKTLASASRDQIIKFWDAATGACTATFEGHRDSVRSVAFSHDSKTLASASRDQTIKLWDAATGAYIITLEGHRDSVNSAAFSHDSKTVASASRDQTIKLWNAATGACIATLEGHRHYINSVAFSHDSKTIASASDDQTIKLWNAATNACTATFEGHRHSVNSVAFSYDSKTVASASKDQTVKLWDAATGACTATLEKHRGYINLVAFSHDSKTVASVSSDQTIKLWDAATGACAVTLEGHRDSVSSVAFSHDSKTLASASDDQTIKLWNAATGACIATLEGQRDSVRSAAFSHDSKTFASASRDQTIKLWDAATGACTATLEGHRDSVRSVAFSHDSKTVASASKDQTIKLWDAATGACTATLEGHRHYVGSVAFSHDSKTVASASYDQTIKLWDAATGACTATLEGYRRYVGNLAFDTTGSSLLTNIGTFTLNNLSLSPTASTAMPALEASKAMTNPLSQHVNRSGVGLSEDNTWITWGSHKVLWLPPTYRPGKSDTTASTVAIGCPSGRVLLLAFSFSHDPLM